MGKGSFRNKKPCLCGTPRKYKDCCWGLSESQILLKAKGRIVNQTFKEFKIKKCLYLKTSECSEGIINAHSLQNNRILNKLSENGEVYMINPLFNENGQQLKLQKIGRKKATTFTGFCKKHDTEVFSPIENKMFSLGDKQQEALFAFRALSKELHAKLLAEKTSANLLEKYQTEEMGLYHHGVSLALLDLEKETNIFSTSLVEKKYNKISTKVVVFSEEYDIAVSSAITLSHDFLGKELEHFQAYDWVDPYQLYLTIFPEEGKTYCLLSYSSEGEGVFGFLDEQLINKNPEEQKELLSRLIVHHCENTVFSPRLIDLMSKEEINSLEKESAKSVELMIPEETLLDKKLSFSLFRQ